MQFLPLDGEADEAMPGLPRAGGDLRVDCERPGSGGRGVVIGKVVDQFLDANRPGRRPVALLQESADVGVGGGVDVDRKGRQRRGGDELKAAFVDLIVDFGAEVCGFGVEGE